MTSIDDNYGINIASFGGKISVPHLLPYCASKFALVGLSDGLRAELAAKKVFVTAVAPGLMRTGSHKSALFKRSHRREFAWFSLGAANPLVSMGVDRAARQIRSAARKKRPELIITFPARAMVVLEALFPNILARTTNLVCRLLPKMPATGQQPDERLLVARRLLCGLHCEDSLELSAEALKPRMQKKSALAALSRISPLVFTCHTHLYFATKATSGYPRFRYNNQQPICDRGAKQALASACCPPL